MSQNGFSVFNTTAIFCCNQQQFPLSRIALSLAMAHCLIFVLAMDGVPKKDSTGNLYCNWLICKLYGWIIVVNIELGRWLGNRSRQTGIFSCHGIPLWCFSALFTFYMVIEKTLINNAMLLWPVWIVIKMFTSQLYYLPSNYCSN